MSNPIDNDIPSIKPDMDQVEAYKSTKKLAPTSKSSGNNPTPSPVNTAKTSKTSGMMIFTMLLIYALAGAGGYWFYQQHMITQTKLDTAELRIQDLERQLSATGEEMGESTIAIKVKLEAVIKKTDELWTEMDKLWASAWRRNQSEIKTLRDEGNKLEKANNSLVQQLKSKTQKLDDINTKQTDLEFNLNAIGEQLTATSQLKSALDKLQVQFNTLENKSSARDSKQLEVATNLNQLETSLNLLMEQIEQLKRQKSTPPVPSTVN